VQVFSQSLNVGCSSDVLFQDHQFTNSMVSNTSPSHH
jgi:hypothetical protein